MYICKDCESVFEDPKIFCERHSLDTPPFERHIACPDCESETISEAAVRYCRCCGARLKHGVYGYCNDACRKKGEKMWRRQEEKSFIIQNGAVARLVRGVALYNREHGTDLSYGQFTATVLPKLPKKEARKYI